MRKGVPHLPDPRLLRWRPVRGQRLLWRYYVNNSGDWPGEPALCDACHCAAGDSGWWL